MTPEQFEHTCRRAFIVHERLMQEHLKTAPRAWKEINAVERETFRAHVYRVLNGGTVERLFPAYKQMSKPLQAVWKGVVDAVQEIGRSATWLRNAE